jgi:hypothetical protein
MLDAICRVASTMSLSAYIGKLGRVAIVVSLSACSGSSVVLLGPLSTSDSGSTQLEPPTFDPPNGFSFPGSSADIIIRCNLVGAGMIVQGAYLAGQPSVPPSVGYLVTKATPSVIAECTDRTGTSQDSVKVTATYNFLSDAGP